MFKYKARNEFIHYQFQPSSNPSRKIFFCRSCFQVEFEALTHIMLSLVLVLGVLMTASQRLPHDR